ncbi:MAG: TIGR00266 family protein [Bacteroidota bacterium]
MKAHEIDYQIHGTEMQFVEIELDPLETVIAESGAFMMMESGIEMATIFGDGSQSGGSGLFGKLLSAGKRLITGESLFMTAYTHNGAGKKTVAFASPYPGRIIALNLAEYRGKIICQKDAFLCAAKGVAVGVEFSRKIGRGLFGGEGFIMQKLEGDGMAFMHAGGTVIQKTLAVGEVLKVDTGCLVGFTQEINYDIEFVKGIRNKLFGGEGFFFASLRGPGNVWIQSLPFARLAGRVLANANFNSGGQGEGSLLGGIGDMLDGDGF